MQVVLVLPDSFQSLILYAALRANQLDRISIHHLNGHDYLKSMGCGPLVCLAPLATSYLHVSRSQCMAQTQDAATPRPRILMT